MQEALKNIFMGIALGLVMAGFVLSIIEGRLLLASRENYWLNIVLYICANYYIINFCLSL